MSFEQLLVSAFIVTFIIFQLVWDTRVRDIQRLYIFKVISTVVQGLGLDLNFSLFAPKPSSNNYLIAIQILYSNDKVESFPIPSLAIENDRHPVKYTRHIKWISALLLSKDMIAKEALCINIVKTIRKENLERFQNMISITIYRHYELSAEEDILGLKWMPLAEYTFKVSDTKIKY